MGVLYLLYESASGYGLFERVKSEEVGVSLPEVQAAVLDLKKFSAVVKLKSFLPFKSAHEALENICAVSEGEVTKFLGDFLELNVPKGKKEKKEKESKIALGVIETKLGNAISETLGIKCQSDDVVLELMRGIRVHFSRFISALKPGDLHKAQLGLAHSYSRSKVKFNVHKVDNMIIQSICLLDQLDKDLNQFAMRCREWYSWHFPELIGIVSDNYNFARLVKVIKQKSSLTAESLPSLTEITEDEAKSQQIIDAAKMSMGTDLSEIDMKNVEDFSERVAKLAEYRKKLHEYLVKKMNDCAPNLSALIGEIVGARLISHAGSLTNLAKYPASTVQILGAEKALFRALKTRGPTPKYGLIFHSSFIGKAGPKNKGRISRYLANKCSIAARIDCFGELATNKFGLELKKQVEERLEFYKSGTAPRKNAEVMSQVCEELRKENGEDEEAAPAEPKSEKKKKKKDKEKKRSAEEMDTADDEAPAKKAKVEEEEDGKEKKKKKKKNKESAE